MKIVVLVALLGALALVTCQDVAQIYCGRTLARTLALVCNGSLIKRSQIRYSNILEDSYWPWITSHRAHSLSKRKGGIVSECCEKPCNVEELMAIDYGLGGLMVWSIDTDDFRGSCEPEPDAYKDFIDRYNDIVDDPLLKEALKNLNLPDANRIENLSRRTAYVVSNNNLHLRLPESEFSNYPIMRTINDAATLALEEKRILDEMEAVTKKNEIEDNEGKKDSAKAVAGSIVCVLICVMLVFKLF